MAARAIVDAGSIGEKMGRFGELQYFERGREIYDESWGAVAAAELLEEKCRRCQPQEHAIDARNLLVGDTSFSLEKKSNQCHKLSGYISTGTFN